MFDGLIKPAQTAKGPAAIAAFLRTRYGGGHEGLSADGLSTMIIDAPVVNLSPDGNSAKVRWNALIFHGHDGKARIEGGVFENDYVREGGVWKIAAAHYYPQFDGPYEEGWTNWGGGDLPVVPHHFDVDTSGIPIPPASGTAPQTKATLAALQTAGRRAQRRGPHPQSAVGLRLLRGPQDVGRRRRSVRARRRRRNRRPGRLARPGGRAPLAREHGPGRAPHGQLNDRVQFDVTVTIAPGGNEAWARGIELGMLGEADQEKGWWEVATFRNRFVKEDGVWKIREMRRFPLMKTDIFQGWGKSRIVDPVPTGAHKPDAPVPAADAAAPGLAMPAFLGTHPVTGKQVVPAGEAKMVAASALTGAIAAGKPRPSRSRRPRAVSPARPPTTASRTSRRPTATISTTPMPAGFGGIMATKGFKRRRSPATTSAATES